MSDPICIYPPEELEGLNKEARDELRAELTKLIEGSREIRAVLAADAEVKTILKEKLSNTFERLKRSRQR